MEGGEMSLSIFYYIQFSILHFIFIHPFSEYLLSSIEGDCELAQQSGNSSDGGRTGEAFPYSTILTPPLSAELTMLA